jgi:hypothetical protein
MKKLALGAILFLACNPKESREVAATSPTSLSPPGTLATASVAPTAKSVPAMPPFSSIAWLTTSTTGGGGPRMKTSAELEAEKNRPVVDPNHPLPRLDLERSEVPFSNGVVTLTETQRTQLEQAYGKLVAREAGCGYDGSGKIVLLRLKDGSSFSMVDTNWGCKKPAPVTTDHFAEFWQLASSMLGEAAGKLPKAAPTPPVSGVAPKRNGFGERND